MRWAGKYVESSDGERIGGFKAGQRIWLPRPKLNGVTPEVKGSKEIAEI
jgi:hypothetical protein